MTLGQNEILKISRLNGQSTGLSLNYIKLTPRMESTIIMRRGSKKVIMPKAMMNFDPMSGKMPTTLGIIQASRTRSEKANTFIMGPRTTTVSSSLVSRSVGW